MIYLGLPILWGWLGAGLALIALEVLIAPGSYLLWIGIAALLMAGLSTLVSFSAGAELAVFGVLGLVCGLIGWRLYGARVENDAARDLHDPAVTFIGRVFTLAAPIENGFGQVRVDDTVWRVAGPALPVGSAVKVKSLDGSTLVVEAA
jgi:membrane protein implicated in regulation of membrane protease activity